MTGDQLTDAQVAALEAELRDAIANHMRACRSWSASSLAGHLASCLMRAVPFMRNQRETYEAIRAKQEELAEQVASLMHWRPIDTAPKDGTRVRLWNGETQGDGYWDIWARDENGWPIGCEENHPDQWIWCGEGWPVDPLPTLWMPLPPVPMQSAD